VRKVGIKKFYGSEEWRDRRLGHPAGASFDPKKDEYSFRQISHRTLKGTESAFSLCVSVELMGFHSYIVAAGFHTRADAIGAMKQVVAEVTPPSLDKEGCQIYHWSQGADDPTLFLLYME